jgi:hypothetical protein
MSSDLVTRCADAIICACHLDPNWQGGYDAQDIHLMREDARRGLASALRLVAVESSPAARFELSKLANMIDPEPPPDEVQPHRRLPANRIESDRIRPLFQHLLEQERVTLMEFCGTYRYPFRRMQRWLSEGCQLQADLLVRLRTEYDMGGP